MSTGYRAPYSILIKYVDVGSVINDLELDISSVTTKSITCRCVVPSHRDSSPSMSIDREKGFWKCFGCGESGSLLRLVEYVKGYQFPESIDYIRQFAPTLSPSEVMNIISEEMEKGMDTYIPPGVEVQTVVSRSLRVSEINTRPVFLPMGTEIWSPEVYTWCESKNIIANNIKSYFPNIGYCRLGHYRGRIIIPVYYKGKMVDFQARDFSNDFTRKDLYITGIPIGNYLFNYDYVDWSKPVGIVEGAIDVFRIWPYYYNTVGVMGSSLSDPQAELLRKAESFIAMPDPDIGGFNLLAAIKTKLAGKEIWLRYFNKNNLSDIVNKAVKIQ